MLQKRSFAEEELYEVSSKHPRHAEPSCHRVSVLECYHESVAVNAYSSGGDKDSFSRIKLSYDVKPDSQSVAKALSPSEKETEMDIHGSASNSSWPNSSTSEEDIRSEAPFHVLVSPEYYCLDHPSSVAGYPREISSSLFCNPPRKMIPVGPDFQAKLPIWGAYGNKDISNLQGTHETPSLSSQDDENELAGTTIIPMPKMELLADHGKNIGMGRAECLCEDVGSIRCVRLHIIEARERLKLSLGEETFVRLGFCDMGEVMAEKWSEEEEELFHEVVFSNPASLGKNFWNHLAIEFPSRRRKELVSYYFNVFMLQKRAEQNRFDPVNVDSDNDECEEVVGAADEVSKMTDEDEDSVVESPAYPNVLGYNGIYEEDDEQTYDEDVGDATWEDYNSASFVSRKVFTDVPESCPGKLFDSNSSYKLNMQPQNQGPSDEVAEQGVKDRSPIASAAGVTSESSVRKTDDHGRRWASDFSGMSGASEHHSALESCNGKEWDTEYLSCAKNEDLLPTHTMIEEVFGDGAWTHKR